MIKNTDINILLIEAIKENLKGLRRQGIPPSDLVMGNKRITYEQLIKEIETGSEIGRELIRGILALTIDLLMRDRKKLKDD